MVLVKPKGTRAMVALTALVVFAGMLIVVRAIIASYSRTSVGSCMLPPVVTASPAPLHFGPSSSHGRELRGLSLVSKSTVGYIATRPLGRGFRADAAFHKGRTHSTRTNDLFHNCFTI
ncbi:hypothetical protein EDD15DRAFT_794285 [Pisolithus albus]|nr:hypothetical protein EDD15DRAFT_794285 [Pisolithus albus]